MKMNWSYIGGFVDGEGSFVKTGNTDYRVLIPQTNEEVLKEIMEFTGVGHICHVTKRKAHWKESWLYFVARQEDVLFFIKQVRPHLIVKRDLAEKFIPIITKVVSKIRTKKIRLRKTKENCKLLRERGLSYRAIGEKLKIDHGYVRRLILFDGKNK